MTHPIEDLYIVTATYAQYSRSDTDAFALSDCPECGGTQVAVLAFDLQKSQAWMRCVNCRTGLVRNEGVTSPSPKPLRIPAGVSGVELDVWKEVRDCLAIGAYTAAVMLCRKLLVHVAVGHGLPDKDERGYSPTFAAASQHLEDEGLITPKMRPWVNRIKDVGNDANHELTAIGAEAAMDVATFTEQLLRLAYEMDALMNSARESASD